MQILTSLSKYFIISVLCCSLLITFNVIDNDNGLFGTSEIGEVNGANTNTVWYSLAQDFQINHETDTVAVQKEIRSLLAHPDQFNQILQAAGPYIYFILKETKAHNLPGEIALIPFIESEFNPNNTSNKGALGLWQLMPQTARDLGVQVKSGYDGRRNVVASTDAALAYFQDLKNSNNDNWYLAIAAYNCGQGRIDSVTKRTGTQDFWKLPLPQETKLYVPKLLAVAAILANPGKYGVQLPAVSNQPYFTQVPVQSKNVSLTSVSKQTGVSVATLQKLNPELKHATYLPKNVAHTVLVPVNNKSALTAVNTKKA
jgi:membrane-bound lytic murein transglycosylase D